MAFEACQEKVAILNDIAAQESIAPSSFSIKFYELRVEIRDAEAQVACITKASLAGLEDELAVMAGE